MVIWKMSGVRNFAKQLKHVAAVHYVIGARQMKAASKTKYICPNCERNAWAKPGAAVICGVRYEEDSEICIM